MAPSGFRIFLIIFAIDGACSYSSVEEIGSRSGSSRSDDSASALVNLFNFHMDT